jgi:hypothetical protein
MRHLSNSPGRQESFFFTLIVLLLCLIFSGPVVAEEYGTMHSKLVQSDTFTPGSNPPAIDLDGWGAVHSSRPGYDATLCWIEVIDHDTRGCSGKLYFL